jgi:hypothetical protein
MNPTREIRKWLPNDWNRWATIANASATFVIAVFSVLLYLVNHKLTEDGEAIQRAYVLSNTEYVIHHEIKMGQVDRIKVSPILVNSGTTPAINLRFYASGKVTNTLPKDFNFPDLPSDTCSKSSERPSIVLGPKAPLEICPVSVSATEMKQIIARHLTLYVWGWATYRDVFKSTVRRTEFCAYIDYADNSVLNPQIPPSNVMMGICGAHNCTDEYCKDSYQGQP